MSVYICPECGLESDYPGKCPDCDVELEEQEDNEDLEDYPDKDGE